VSTIPSPPARAAADGPAELDPMRHHAHLKGHAGAFGSDSFGRSAERFARFFGTPAFIIGQSVVVVAWIAVNAAALAFQWDPYPFILLNLAFSTQAAYAAPLILLAATRQAERDTLTAIADTRHREDVATMQAALLRQNTALTERIEQLMEDLHATICTPPGERPPAVGKDPAAPS
jgi:uncharacterized membrane protein